MVDENMVTLILGITSQIGLLLLGYWRFADRKKVDHATTAAVIAAKAVTRTAEEVKVKMEQTVSTIEDTKSTVEKTAVIAARVQEQTDGHLTAIETLLENKTRELAAESQKVARLMTALHEARGVPGRRGDDTP